MKPHEEALELASGQRLAELEKVINRGKKGFIEVGLALAEIRDLRLYQSEFKSFGDYCREKWGWGKGYCNHVIRAAEVVGALPETATIVATETQARELARVPKADRAKVLKAVVEAGPLTARAIREAAEGARVPEAGRAEVLEAVVEAGPPPYRIVNGRCVVLQSGWTFGRRVLMKLLNEVRAD